MAGNAKNKRKSAGIRKTIQTRTPILFRFTEEQSERMKKVCHDSLDKFRRREATGTDWRNIAYRLNVGIRLTSLFQEVEAEKLLVTALNCVCEIKERWVRMQEVRWAGNETEIEMIDVGLHLVDDMQDNATRKELLGVHKDVEKFFQHAYKKD